MLTDPNLHDLALSYHRQLPDRIRAYLNARGIPDELIHRHLLGWSGLRITIPIPDRDREIAFFKLARDPEDDSGPKMYVMPGSPGELYGWETVLAKPEKIIICEGEFDRLVLEAQGFKAVTSTGGAGSFRAEWAEHFLSIPEVYICFDRDDAGRLGAERVDRLIPQARIVDLPEEVGKGGDVTDFFVRLGRSREEYEGLLDTAQSAPLSVFPPRRNFPISATPPDLAVRIERIKQAIPIEDFIAQYVALRHSGRNLVGRCSFHDDRVPSLVVFPATNSFHCFGCRAGGDVISFLRLKMNLSFSEALDSLEQVLPRHDTKSAA